jgi:hypothetical protein
MDSLSLVGAMTVQVSKPFRLGMLLITVPSIVANASDNLLILADISVFQMVANVVARFRSQDLNERGLVSVNNAHWSCWFE